MLFNSYPFWAFFFFVYLVYWRLPKALQNRYLLIVSYVFYGFWDWRFLSLIILSTLVDYWAGKNIVKHYLKRKFYLSISLVTNLTILGFFKYFGFFSDQLSQLLATVGISYLYPTIDVILPVGISFYTFQTMSYTIDIYRKDSKPIESLINFALYVSFFPQLVAGPIERSYRLIPQIVVPREFTKANISDGIYLITYGLFLKLVIADNMAIISDSIFSENPGNLLGSDVLIGSYAFAFQIYGDFSGYSSIARGLAKCLGIDLITNFKIPYISKDPSEFWNRWHISLSSWLKDYLYIPLGGNKHGRLKTFRNLFITMFLGGLWHGANLTFIAWGVFHGTLLILYHFIKEKNLYSDFNYFNNKYSQAFMSFSRSLIMFHLVCLGWILFRSETIFHAYNLVMRLFLQFQISSFFITSIGLIGFFVLPFFIYEIWNDRIGSPNFQKRSAASLIIFFNYCFFMIVIFQAPSTKEFIYFQF